MPAKKTKKAPPPAFKPTRYTRRERALLCLLEEVSALAKELDRKAAEARGFGRDVFLGATRATGQPAGSAGEVNDYLMALTGIPLVTDAVCGIIDCHIPPPSFYRPDAAE